MGYGRRASARWRVGLLCAVAVASLGLAIPGRAQQLASAPTAQKLTPAPLETTRTRFIINLERQVDFEVSALAHPNRVLVDLPEVKLVLPDPIGDSPVGLIKSFRHGLSAPGKARIVIDVTGPVVVERSELEKSPDGKTAKLTIDIVSAGGAAAVVEARAAMRAGALGLGAAGLQPPVPRPAIPPAERAQGLYRPIIVIDPGHGGDDSGAQRYGTVEKDVVLSFSLKLREKLNASGRYKVMMTRDKDVFVPLEERREFAERNQAALFIAIHADYTGRASARGATIYSLRPQVAANLRRAAKDEVGEDVLSGKEVALVKQAHGDVGAVRNILADLARQEVELNQERTNLFVRSVLDFMGSTTNMMDNPDRNAAFVVLKTAKVPSILLELGYITNSADAQQLRSDKWRDKVSGSIMTAIDNYFAKLPR